MQGTIHRIRADKGFGFIRPDGDHGQGDHFFHRSALVDVVFDERLLNMLVEFDSTMNDKGLTAQNVRPVEVTA